MDFKVKQEWLEAVMASGLSPATKVYAFGIYQHMYGKKTDSFPGVKALVRATGLNDSKFYAYNTALVDAGFLDVTPRRGKSNEYTLKEGTPRGGNHLPPQEVPLPPEGVPHTPTGGTNTTRNTTSKTTKSKTTKETVADAPVVPLDKSKGDSPNPSFEDNTGEAGPLEKANGTLEKDGRYWRELRKQRPLTPEENEEIAASARHYMEKHRAPEEEVAAAW